MNFKNKIFITFLIFFAFILFFNINNSFAVVSTDSSNANILLDKVENYFNNNNLTLYHYIITNNGFVYAFTMEDFQLCVNTYNGNTYVYCIYFYCFEFDEDYNYTFPLGEKEIKQFCDYIPASTVIYSTKDIYWYNDNTLFFPLTPVPLKTLGVEIPALETAEQIPQAIATTLKILIPIGLVVLGIGLTIFLIKRVIYLFH